MMAAARTMITTQYRQVASFLSTTLMSLIKVKVETEDQRDMCYPVVARSRAFTFSVLSPMSSISSF